MPPGQRGEHWLVDDLNSWQGAQKQLEIWPKLVTQVEQSPELNPVTALQLFQ
jgi:hypothetical protein